MRALGMRLMHLGKTVYVVGETTTPSIAAEDLLILGSGSGRTTGLLAMAEKARSRGAQIMLFTTDATSPRPSWPITGSSFQRHRSGRLRGHYNPWALCLNNPCLSCATASS